MNENEKEIKPITEQQRKALHLLFAFVAKEYEAAGYDLHKLLTEFPAIHVPIQTKHIKEIWRAAQIEQTGIESTENAGNHLTEVYETFNRHVAQAGIHVPFPSLESLYNKSRRQIGL